jgi:hypothetical protein
LATSLKRHQPRRTTTTPLLLSGLAGKALKTLAEQGLNSFGGSVGGWHRESGRRKPQMPT